MPTAAKKKVAIKRPAAATKTASGKTIAAYVAGLSGWQATAVQQLCALVQKAAPAATGSIKWAQPASEDHGPFCYVRAFASHVNFGFWRGADLPDPEGRLHGGGKRMAHVKITGLEDIDAALGHWSSTHACPVGASRRGRPAVTRRTSRPA